MKYIDLNTGFALLGQPDYSEHKRVKQLCIDKHKFIAYAGEPGNIMEIQAKHWAMPVHNGYQNYTIPLNQYRNSNILVKTPSGVGSGRRSVATAVQELERLVGHKIMFVLIVSKR